MHEIERQRRFLDLGLARVAGNREIAALLAVDLYRQHDLVVHRQDMPILPGNIGNLPLLGLGLWNYPWMALALEVVLGVVGLAIYFRWASQKSQRDPRWYLGPVITALIFVALVLFDLPASPLA